jgi:uncharacterized protein involved in exopolysaccharide biosynthesis
MLGTIPQKEKVLIDISRQQTIKNSIFNFLLQKREETALSYASSVPDSRIVEPAKSLAAPISPKVNNIYLIGLALGISLGLLFVLFKEGWNPRILFRSDIEKRVKITIISEIMLGDNS